MTDIEGEMEQQKGLAIALTLLRAALHQVKTSKPEKTTLMSALKALLGFFDEECSGSMIHAQYEAMDSDSDLNAALLMEEMDEYLRSKGHMDENGTVFIDDAGNFAKPE